MYLICVLFATLFIQGHGVLHHSSVPRIYPQRPHVTVDAGTDMTLGCRGAEPMRWEFSDAVNGQHFTASKKEITYINNTKELEYVYETILTVYNVSHINMGFYYCHGEKVDFDTPRRSSKIYIFVYDAKNLSVISSEENMFVNHVWLASVPCRPTSPDINVSLSCNGGVGMSVYPGNYSEVFRGDVYVVQFHVYYGFTVQYHSYIRARIIHRCSCVFKRSNATFTIHLSSDWKHGPYLLDGMTIDIPDTAEVGENIRLQCVYLDYKYFPYDRYWPEWNIPRNKRTEKIEVIKLKAVILLINVIILKNISTEDEGTYTCQMDSRLNFYVSDSKYIFVNDKNINHTVPRIYSPNEGEIQIHSGDNITLRCAGSRPITWEARRSNQAKKSYNIEHVPNKKNELYEVYLHIMAAHYTDTGLYYCHETDSKKNHPFKSDKIYIFVKDKQNLYVSHEKEYEFAETYANVTVPCLPTSREVNVSLSIEHRARDPYSESYSPGKMITPMIHAYDPQEGYVVQMPGPGEVTAKCIFETESTRDTTDREYYINDYYVEPYPFVTGPPEDLVFVGQTLELFCNVRVQHNVPVNDKTFSWTSPNQFTSDKMIVELKVYNCDIGKVLISKLILHDIEERNEGRYFCHIAYNNATADKFITVYDNFDVKPVIEIVEYDYAYIGLPLLLRCKVIVEHNVVFLMSWTTPNITEIKTIQMKYIPNLRNTTGESILKIHNTTNEIAGNYSCYVCDTTNRIKYITKNIVVKRGEKPRIMTSNFDNQEEIVVLFEETVNLTCFAEGDPKPVITWMKGSSELRNFSQHIDFSSNNSELTISNVQRIDDGQYTCVAQNPFGRDSRVVYLRLKSASISPYIATVIFLLILILITSVLLSNGTDKQKKLREELNEVGFINFKFGEIQCLNPVFNTADQAGLLPYDTKWEIPREKIKLGRNLGSGYFGLVVEATVSDFFEGESQKTVAVKMVHGYCGFIELNSLICELKIMTHLGKHVNLINLLGACTDKIAGGNLLVVIEYCKHGSLKNYLMENRSNFVNLIDPVTELISFPDNYYLEEVPAWRSPTSEFTTLQLLLWALQVARGMEFLAARQVLHGDLAIRNVLLDENYVVKISDFGLSKTLSSSGYYKKSSQCPLPVKWMAIESIRDKTFSTQSDVWAFGVVLWELFSLARTPYAELEPDFRFYRKLESGYRLERPEYSTKEIYQVMRECWSERPHSRPTFSYLTQTLTDLLQDPNKRCSAESETTSNECASLSTHNAAASFHAASQDDRTTVPDWVTLDILPSRSSIERLHEKT